MGYGNYPDLSSVKKVLVIKLRHFGDVLLTTPVFSILKKALPNAQIDAYVYQECASLLEENPSIHQIFCYDQAWKKKPIFSRIAQEWKLLKTLRNQHYDLVLNLTEGDRGAIAAKVSKAPIRVGWDPQNQGFFGKKHLYTHTVKSCGSPRHHVEKNLDALRKIGIFPLEEEKALYFPRSPKAQNFIDGLLEKYQLAEHRFFVFHPTTRWRFKGWKIEHWQEVARVLQKKGKKIVFVSGPDLIEKETISSIIKDLDPSLTVDLSGKLSIQELGALFSKAEKVICLDSLAFHIANALKVPVIVLFGPSSDKIWGPWQNPHAKVMNKNFSCRPCSMDGCGGSKKSACLLELLPEEVLQEMKI